MRIQWLLLGPNINEFYFDVGGVWSHACTIWVQETLIFFHNSIITTDDKRIELLDIIKTPRGGN